MASPRHRLVPWTGLLVALALPVVAYLVPTVTGWEVRTRAARSASPDEVPPLHGLWDPAWFGAGTLPALVLALLGVTHGARWAATLPWGRLLVASYAGAWGWLVSLALVDGTSGLSRTLGNPFEYLPTARAETDLGELMATYVDRIPIDAEDNWPTHVAGHPPGMVLFFSALVRLGLGGDLAAGVVVTLIAASIPAAVLTTLRRLGAETWSRGAAPFVVLTPAAVFLAVSADAVITAVTAWGVAALAVAATSDRRTRLVGWSVVAGTLLGLSVFLSYGMPLMGLLCLAVLAAARSWRPLPIAVVAATAVAVVFAVAGFAWWEAYPVLRERYYDGVASDRPYGYWVWANLGALAVSTGPLLGAGLAWWAARVRERVPLLLVGAGVLMVLAADLSGMSKAEVERIWLPFIPWLTVSLALLPPRWHRPGLALQVGSALLVQHLLYTVW